MATHKIHFADRITEHLNFRLLYINYVKHDEAWDNPSQTYNFTQLFFVLDGKGTLTIDDVNYGLKPNSFIVINSHVKHRIQSDPSSRLEYYACAIEDLSFQFGPGPNNPSFGIYNYENSRNKIVPLLEMMYRDAMEKSPGFEIICNDMTEILITHFVWTQKVGLIFHHDPLMSRECSIAKGFIDTHYMDNITLGQLEKITHTNKFYLIHSFDKYIGESPMNYLQKKRIQVAERQLVSTSYSISSIASNVGFSSQSYFAQAFKKHFGLTPGQYRKKYGEAPHGSQ